MSHPWMPFYVADYLSDTMHLSTVEHGAYLLLIMHYWQHGSLPADDAKLARICRMTPDAFAEARDTLSSLFGEGWSHKRIDAELSRTDDKRQKRVEAGRRGGLAKADGSKCLANATVLPEQKATNYNHSHKEEHPSPPSVVRPPQKVRGEFLSADWHPSPANFDWAVAELGSRDAVLRQFEKFQNYWFAKSGADGRKRDWDATWRNWIMREADNGKRNGGNPQRQHRPASGHDNLLTAMDELVGSGHRRDERPADHASVDDAYRDTAGVYRLTN